MRRVTFSALLLSLIASSGCLWQSAPPSDYSIVSPVSELFQGTLDPKGSVFYSFVSGNPDPVKITFASLTNSSTGAAVSTTLRLGFGVPDGTTCSTSFSTTAAAALVAQYFQVNSPGTYCVVVSDPGTVTTQLKFAVKISHS